VWAYVDTYFVDHQRDVCRRLVKGRCGRKQQHPQVRQRQKGERTAQTLLRSVERGLRPTPLQTTVTQTIQMLIRGAYLRVVRLLVGMQEDHALGQVIVVVDNELHVHSRFRALVNRQRVIRPPQLWAAL
jgi:hypothetical protein